MSEFSMMTQGIEWPMAYGDFMVCPALIGWLNFRVLDHLEREHSDLLPPTALLNRPF